MAVLDAPLTMPNKTFETDAKAHKNNAKALEDFALQIFGSLVPVGTVVTYAGVTPPSGWLACNGAAVSRTTYNTLFQIIGTAFGAGDGSTTFNLPDVDTGVMVRGVGIGFGLGGTGSIAAAGSSVPTINLNYIIKT